jgi:hypothetical protein
MAGHGGDRPVGSGLASGQLALAHQLPHELGTDLLILTNDPGMHPTIPIGLIEMDEEAAALEWTATAMRGEQRIQPLPSLVVENRLAGQMTHHHSVVDDLPHVARPQK